MAGISAEQKFKLDKLALVSTKVGLGTLLDAATGAFKAVAAGTFTTAGGDAAETITDALVAATDVCIVSVMTAGATPRSVVAANTGSGSIAVTLSGDPSTDHVLQYIVFRAV